MASLTVIATVFGLALTVGYGFLLSVGSCISLLKNVFCPMYSSVDLPQSDECELAAPHEATSNDKPGNLC